MTRDSTVDGEDRDTGAGLTRRHFMVASGATGATALAGCPGNSDPGTETESETPTEAVTETETESNEPSGPSENWATGPTRFIQVGQRLMDPIFTDANHGFDRDNLAPRIPDPQRDPDNYDPDEFSWSVAERPDGSEAQIEYAPAPYDDSYEQYDAGQHNVAEFEPDVPGTYVLEMEAPDGTDQQTVHVFPAAPAGAGGPPQLELHAGFDEENDEFVVTSETELAPDSNAAQADLEVAFLPGDEDALSADDLDLEDGGTAVRISADAVEEQTSVFAAAFDGQRHSMTDEVTLDPDEGSVSLPNRPPEWLDNAVVYEIFTRSFAGEEQATDFEFLKEKVSYLDELGVDVVWLTPIVPAWSAWLEANTDNYAPGGPHGYSTGDFFDVADDLGSLETFDAFVEACHEQDIRVCFDLVINHCGWTNPKFQNTIAETASEPEHPWRFPGVEAWNEDSKYFDWFDRMEGSSDFDAAPAQASFFGVRLQPNLNYGNLALREHILAAVDFWSDRVDAFRCDIAWGVPHSFWKEVRDHVKRKDTEFLLLDESIPNDPNFAESEFDVHFDTKDFMSAVHEVARGYAKPRELIDAVHKRAEEGFPDYTRLINATENHDEPRVYHEAKASGTRDDPARAQRAAAAAAFTLPGVPFLYYGQERLVSEHGTRRTSPFEDDPNRADDIERDPFKRAFMNWEENGDAVPGEHLQFYKDLVDFYHESSVLSPDSTLVEEWHRTDAEDDVLVFGRDAGDEKRVVVVNFGSGSAQVDLRTAVSTVDKFGGGDLAVDSSENTNTVEVDTLAVFEADSLLGFGEKVLELEDPAGDDAGPGTFTYPTDDGVADGALDLSNLTIYESRDDYQFEVEVDGPVENPWDLEHGISVQHLQLYFQRPDALWGTEEARQGVNAMFDAPYQYRVLIDGDHGVRVETATDKLTVERSLKQTPDGTLFVEIPKDAFQHDISSYAVAALMLGYDAEAEGNVMPVESTAGERALGGRSNAAEANVVDLITPEGTDQQTVLSTDGESPPVIPYVSLQTSFEEVATWNDPTGDEDGPGSYTYPTSDDFYEGSFDVTQVRLSQSRERYRIEFELATEIENPWGLPRGFSHQFFQVYVRDTAATDGQRSSVEGRFGLNANFEKPYHYRIVANGEGATRVEQPHPDQQLGEVVANDVTAGLSDERTVKLEFRKGAVGGSLDGSELAFLVAPYDGFGDGGIRGIAASNAEYTIGGGKQGAANPAVMDMVTPSGTTQSEALSYTADEPATLPYVALGTAKTGNDD